MLNVEQKDVVATSTGNHSVREHFDNGVPEVKATYNEILNAARKLGTVREEAKKTSIHLVRKSAFAGIATRKTALILTLKSASDIRESRIIRCGKASTNRWHVEIRLRTPDEVDEQIIKWLEIAFELSG